MNSKPYTFSSANCRGLPPGRKVLIVLYFFIQSCFAYAQHPSQLITAQKLLQNPEGYNLDSSLWAWRSGDEYTSKNPDTTASGWQSAPISFGLTHPLPNWKGIGWFRTWIRADKSIVGRSTGFRINQKGASEIYFDGHKIGGFGKVGSSATTMVSARATHQVLPFVIPDTLPHLLAVRYSNFGELYPDFLGFQVWLGDFQTMADARHSRFRQYDFLLLSVSVEITLALLHFLLFLFYRRQKLNLYYSFFVACMLISGFAKYVYVATSVPAIQSIANLVFLCFMPLLALSGGILLYAVGYPRLPKLRIIIIIAISFVLITYNISDYPSCECREPDPGFLYGNIFLGIVTLDGLVSIVNALRAKNQASG